jgi:uncharacterized heparinase superfamily protein
MPDPLLVLRTVRGLRWRQWAYRPLRRLQARLGAPPAPAAAATDDVRAARMRAVWEAAGPGDPAERVRRAREVAAGRFDFVGHAETLAAPDWRARPVSPLWTYNLHYFGYAADLAWAWRETGDAAFARCFETLAGGWMEQTAGGRGPGWEPYALSLRVVSWMRARLLFGPALSAGFGARLDASVHGQLAFLGRRLEWHILANHLQKNLHALVLGGLFFTGSRAAAWRTGGLRRLWRELFEQVLPDGGHFERSPMYHAIALGDFLELVALLDACGVPVPAAARERVRRMAAAWTCLSRPGGQPHLFNDAAEDVAPDGAALHRLAVLALGAAPERPRGAWALPDTGYFGWEGPGERVVVDCGPPGPRYQPGHAHCDALSFELDLGGHPVVVDSGTRGYDGDPLREYVRSTRAHSTVEIGGREQSEVWGTFRVGRMARVRAGEVPADGAGEFRFSGECRPYHDRRAAHLRRLERRGGAWRVEDRVRGAAGAPLRAFIHFHPAFELRVDGDAAVATSAGATVGVRTWGADRLRVARGELDPAQGWHAPRFGAAVPAPVLVLEIDHNDERGFGFELRGACTPGG